MSDLIYTYRRVSEPEKKTRSISLDWQQSMIDGYLADKGLLAAENFVDDGVTGSLPLRKRAAGAKLFSRLPLPGAVVVCAKFDRIFRDVLDQALTMDEWRKNGTTIVSATEAFDQTTNIGELLLNVMGAFAQFERRTIAERVQAAVDIRRKRGLRVARHAPYGWRYQGGIADKDGKLRGEVMVKDQTEQSILALIMKWRRHGKSLREIAALLDDDCVPTRKGAKWSHASVQTILKDMAERRKSKVQGE
jgi:site-specific DNA recombinase